MVVVADEQVQREHGVAVVVAVGMLGDAAMDVGDGLLAVAGELLANSSRSLASTPQISAHCAIVFDRRAS